MARGVTAFLLLLVSACASAPPPTAEQKRRDANPRAVISGVVRRVSGAPAAGIGVSGIPLGWDVSWIAPVTTDGQGRFRLEVPAPADYAFLLRVAGRTVITDDPRDPGRVRVTVVPAGRTDGIELVYLEELWRERAAVGERAGARAASSRLTIASIRETLPAARSANPPHIP